MTWPAFFKWLETNGFKHSRGTIHYDGQGHWFPNVPTFEGERVIPPNAPWIHVFKSAIEIPGRATIETADVSTSYSEAVFNIEKPKNAKEAVERALMDFDLALGGEPFVSLPFRPQPEVRETKSKVPVFRLTPRDYSQEHVPTYGPRQGPPRTTASLLLRGDSDARSYKTCSCGREYTQRAWDELPLLGLQKIEADEEAGEPATVFTARNCASCSSTMYVDQALEARNRRY